MTFFGPSMTEKTMVEARARKIEEFPVMVVVGAERCTEVCTFLSYTYARVCEALALTEPERLHFRLRITEPERSIDGC